MALTEVLYLSYDGMTDPLGQSQVIPYLEGLTKKGYHYHLISFEKEIPYERDKELIGNLLKSKNIEWHPLTYTKRPPVLSTLWDLYRMKSKGAGLIRKHGISLVHCRSYISGLAGLDFQQRFNIPFLFDMRGFWADERVDGKLWNVSKPIYKIVYSYFKKKEREMLFKADGVISLTENAKAEIESWKVRSTQKLPITVIPCCVDTNLFSKEKVDIQQVENWKQKFTEIIDFILPSDHKSNPVPVRFKLSISNSLLANRRFINAKVNSLLANRRFILAKANSELANKSFILTNRIFILANVYSILANKSFILANANFILAKAYSVLTDRSFIVVDGYFILHHWLYTQDDLDFRGRLLNM